MSRTDWLNIVYGEIFLMVKTKKAMTLRDFSCLSNVGKDEAVALKGTFVTEDIIPGYKVILYKIDNFYVEVFYDLKGNAIKRFKGCVRSDLLMYASA